MFWWFIPFRVDKQAADLWWFESLFFQIEFQKFQIKCKIKSRFFESNLYTAQVESPNVLESRFKSHGDWDLPITDVYFRATGLQVYTMDAVTV